jgi:hypothetical protein
VNDKGRYHSHLLGTVRSRPSPRSGTGRLEGIPFGRISATRNKARIEMTGGPEVGLWEINPSKRYDSKTLWLNRKRPGA